MDTATITKALRRWWYITIISALAIGLAAGIWAQGRPSSYESTAEIFISSVPADAAADATTALTLSRLAQDRILTYANLVDSPRVLEPVRESLGLSRGIDELDGQISTSNPPGTVLLQITVQDEDSEQAALIANAVAQSMAAAIERLETPPAGDVPLLQATITSPATPSSGTIGPGWVFFAGLGGLAGFVVGLAIAIVLQHRDKGVRSEEELAQAFGGISLGEVPADRALEQIGELPSGSSDLEPFRGIRTSVRFAGVDRRLNTIAVMSAQSGEGKTTVTVNLGIVMAQAGMRVCLVDLDLRRPRLTEHLGLDANVGVTNVLVEDVPLEDAIISWRRGLLDVLPTGMQAPNPSELLSSRELHHLLDRLVSRYDVVLIDSAPALPVSDGAIVAGTVDGTIVVARYRRTDAAQLRRLRATLERAGAHVLGTVLNGAPRQAQAYDAYYGGEAGR